MSEQVHTKTTETSSATSATAGLEKWADELINKKQPLQLPADVRKWIADNSWWITLIGGIFSLLSAWGFWQAGHFVDSIARVYGVTGYTTDLGVMWYVALAGLALQGALMLLAVSRLKEHKKAGWKLLFYVSLLSLAVSIVYLLVPSYGVGSLLSTLIGTAISWFFLFQVRSNFTK